MSYRAFNAGRVHILKQFSSRITPHHHPPVNKNAPLHLHQSFILHRQTTNFSIMTMNRQVAADYSSAEFAPEMSKYDKGDVETRRKLFLQLIWKERRHFLKVPAADRRLPQCDRLQCPDDDSDISDIDGSVNPYGAAGRFQQQWTNEAPDSHDKSLHHGAPNVVAWHSYDLYTTPNTPGFMASSGQPRHPDGTECVDTSFLISSQLLLYRLIAVFGMPRSSEVEDLAERYKSIWSYSLRWKPSQDQNNDQPNSSLELFDYKGWWGVHFSGSEEASRSALDLLEWLASDYVPHPYDYVLAGKMA